MTDFVICFGNQIHRIKIALRAVQEIFIVHKPIIIICKHVKRYVVIARHFVKLEYAQEVVIKNCLFGKVSNCIKPDFKFAIVFL